MKYNSMSDEWPSVNRAILAALTVIATDARKHYVPEERFVSRERVEELLVSAGFTAPGSDVETTDLLDAANTTQSAARVDEIEIGGFFAGASTEAIAYGPPLHSSHTTHLAVGALQGLIFQEQSKRKSRN